MAHGKSSFKIPPLFKKEKEFYSIVNNPTKFKALMEVVDKAAQVNEHFKNFKSVQEWSFYVETLLPEFDKKEEFINKLEELVDEYSDEQEERIPTDLG